MALSIAVNVAGPSIKYVTALPVRRLALLEIAPDKMLDHRVGSIVVAPFEDEEESLEDESDEAPCGTPPGRPASGAPLFAVPFTLPPLARRLGRVPDDAVDDGFRERSACGIRWE